MADYSDEEIEIMLETLANMEFEPFSELSIALRRKAPEFFMVIAKIAFGGKASEADAKEAEKQLRVRLEHLAHLAATQYGTHGPQPLQ